MSLVTKLNLVALGLGGALALAGAVLSLSGVFAHERGELDRRGEWKTLASAPLGAARLTLVRVGLREGEAVTFEVCARDALTPAKWAGAGTLAVWPAGEQEALVEAPLDAALLSGDATTQFPEGACVRLAEAGSLGASGDFEVGVEWPAGTTPPARARDVPLQGHVLARQPLGSSDRTPLALVVLGVMLALLALGLRGPAAVSATAVVPAGSLTRPLVGAVVLAALVLAPAVVPLPGATLVLLFALVLATSQVALSTALVLPAVGSTRAETLALRGPARLRWLALLLAPLAGVALFFAGRVLAAVVSVLVPQGGPAAIETFVDWPSASLAVATVAVVAPVAEELFFRGFVYGSLAPRVGVVAASAITVVAFVLPHLPQVWGAWGALAALVLTSIVLTALRVLTGSTVVSAAAHLTHNVLLALIATS
jgi:membrane protease YdiL (CAAX protease family)